MSSDQRWLIGDRKSRRVMGLAFGKRSRERGGAVRIQLVSHRMPVGKSQLLLIMGNLEVRCLAGDTYLVCSSIGGGLGLPCPSTF